MLTTEVVSFEGGILNVVDVPFRKCECDTIIALGDGVIVDGYKGLLEKNGIIGAITVSFDKLKERFGPMDFIRPHLQS
ncbi:hypothetical protein [Paenibacillus sp. UNC496MF]|uniref:hypothetical protein n=1 Tax=Paenibacillus sp. UNC496MF TaxID=1502753 RepID=UPI00210DCC7B|nr:hypothetical protein [Paenibacillus sp. UNC496MF]